MTHNNPERPGLADLLAAHREQQEAVPAQRTGRIDLAEIRSRLAAADPALVDHMVEEVEKLRFGHEAFDLAQEYLAAGKLDCARHWLAVAARHGIDEAEPLLADVDVILEALEPSQATDVDNWAALEQAHAADERERHVASVDDLHDAAEVLRQAHTHARSLVRAAQKSADEILAEARRETNSRDDAVPAVWNLADLPRTGVVMQWKPADPGDPGDAAQHLADLLIRVGRRRREPAQAGRWLADPGDPGAAREYFRRLVADACDHTGIWRPLVTPETPSTYLVGPTASVAFAAVDDGHRRPSAGFPVELIAVGDSNCVERLTNVRLTTLSSCVDALQARERIYSTVFGSALRLWTPTGRLSVSDAGAEQRQEREKIVAGPKFRQAIDHLKKADATT